MFNLISEIMAQWYLIINAFTNTMNFNNAKKLNCALMFIISNHYGRIVISSLIKL